MKSTFGTTSGGPPSTRREPIEGLIVSDYRLSNVRVLHDLVSEMRIVQSPISEDNILRITTRHEHMKIRER